MAEALGVAASAIQLAEIGLQLSTSLYTYIDTVSSADRRLTEVATKVQLTTTVIQEVGLIFDAPEIVALRKDSAVTTAKSTLHECASVFSEIEDAIVKSRKNRYLFPFRAPKITALSASLESLKSNLALLLHVLQHAHRIASDEKARKETEDRIRERDEALRELAKQLSSDADSVKSLPPYESGQGTGVFVALNENVMDVEYTKTEKAGQVTPKELASCVDGLKQLIQHIEHLQSTIVPGTPTPEPTNELIATYASVKQTLDNLLPESPPPKEPPPKNPQRPTMPSTNTPPKLSRTNSTHRPQPPWTPPSTDTPSLHTFPSTLPAIYPTGSFPPPRPFAASYETLPSRFSTPHNTPSFLHSDTFAAAAEEYDNEYDDPIPLPRTPKTRSSARERAVARTRVGAVKEEDRTAEGSEWSVVDRVVRAWTNVLD